MIKFIARLSSYIFHPLLLIPINLFLIICFKPQWFGVNHWRDKTTLLLIIGIYSLLIPGISFVMLKFLNIIKSFEMKEKTERIFPLIICMIFYLWLWINLKQDPAIPNAWNMFILSAIVATGLSLAINNWIKISLHVVGIVSCIVFWIFIRVEYCNDGMCFFRLDIEGNNKFQLDYMLMILFIIGGWVTTTRLLLKAHENIDIVVGTLVGICSVLIANKITY